MKTKLLCAVALLALSFGALAEDDWLAPMRATDSSLFDRLVTYFFGGDDAS